MTSTAGARTAFFAFAAVMGISMASIFLVFTGQSIATTFFISASTHGPGEPGSAARPYSTCVQGARLACGLVLLVPALARFRRPFVFLCLSVLGLMAATFVVEPFPFFDWGAGPYWLAVVAIALGWCAKSS